MTNINLLTRDNMTLRDSSWFRFGPTIKYYNFKHVLLWCVQNCSQYPSGVVMRPKNPNFFLSGYLPGFLIYTHKFICLDVTWTWTFLGHLFGVYLIQRSRMFQRYSSVVKTVFYTTWLHHTLSYVSNDHTLTSDSRSLSHHRMDWQSVNPLRSCPVIFPPPLDWHQIIFFL